MDDELRILFHELADLTPDERNRVLNERPLTPEIRLEVESLLNYDSLNDQHFTACIAGAAGEMLHSAAGQEAGYCGPYRLVRLLGRGGMGSVYLGERTDGEIQQKVAVKLLTAEGGRSGWRDRFLKERQLLASLNHPSIVHVIDAGHTEEGRPYLVMEYVDGVPIDIYSAQISFRDRLVLFLRVCEGVSHAHRHLIIHRDLKPSNIFVDGSAQPKIMDFGIAKLLDETGDTTQTIERLLTPSYASPEQFSRAVQTTATDIYSLGAVLYKLLAGRSPNEPGLQEVPAASRLNPDVPTDIDYILRKALRCEPEERYASVEAFGNDVRAFLESRPVAARSGNAWYRTRKLLRRYWVPASAATLVIASLATGLYIANRERAIAERRFGQLRQLSNKIFDLDKTIRDLPGSIQARQSLVSASLEYLEGLAADARGDLDLNRELGQGYWRVALIQGVPTELNLGNPAKAEGSLKKADELIDSVLASRPRDRSALLRSAAIAEARMILAQEAHRNADAQIYAQNAARRMHALESDGGARKSELFEATGIYTNIALACLNMHLYAKAVPYARRSVDLARLDQSDSSRVAQGLSVLASALRYQGNLEAALRTIVEARRIVEQAVYPSETRRMFEEYAVLLRQGLILGEDGSVNLGRLAEAIEPLQKAFDLTEAEALKDPNDATSRVREANVGNYLADILRHRDPSRALAVYDLSIRRLREIPNSLTARRSRAKLLADSSYALSRLHRSTEAKQRIDAAFAIFADAKDYPAERVTLDGGVYLAFDALAEYYAEQEDPHRAIETYEQLLAKVSATIPEAFADLRDAPRLSRLYEALARLYLRTGETAKAEDMDARRLDLWRSWDAKLPDNAFVCSQLLMAHR